MGQCNCARSELEEKQILAGYQAVEDLVKMTQVRFVCLPRCFLTAFSSLALARGDRKGGTE